MKEIAVIHIGERNADESLSLLGQEVCAHLRGTGGDADKVVESPFGLAVEDVEAAQGSEALFFVVGLGRTTHAGAVSEGTGRV